MATTSTISRWDPGDGDGFPECDAGLIEQSVNDRLGDRLLLYSPRFPDAVRILSILVVNSW
jgi:hypothetical protein